MKIKFSLSSILILFSLIALIVLVIALFFRTPEVRYFQIKWQYLNVEEIKENVQNGKQTVVVYCPDWAIGRGYLLYDLIVSDELAKAIDLSSSACMRFDEGHPEAILFSKYIERFDPFVLIYTDDFDKPVYLSRSCDGWPEVLFEAIYSRERP